jgi:hypothetical protein
MSISSPLAEPRKNAITMRTDTVDNLFFGKDTKIDYIKADLTSMKWKCSKELSRQ